MKTKPLAIELELRELAPPISDLELAHVARARRAVDPGTFTEITREQLGVLLQLDRSFLHALLLQGATDDSPNWSPEYAQRAQELLDELDRA